MAESKRNQKLLPLPAITEKSLHESRQKRELLAKVALLLTKELSEEFLEMWDQILLPYSVDEVDYAVEYWLRNGQFFPKPAQLLQVIRTYRDGNRYLKSQRYPGHGQGYGETDVDVLWNLFKARREKLKRPMGEEDTAILLDELDKLTGQK